MTRFAIFGMMALLPAAEPKAVFTDPAVTLLGGPSLDGRYFSLVERGNLAVRDLSTGASKRLTDAQGKEFAYFSSISRDSKSVAYAWFNEEGFYELRLIPIGGGTPRLIFKNREAGFVQPTAWTPDNKAVLTLLFRKDNVSQIALIPADGGEARVLRSLNWVYPKRMDISPGGETLIYDSFAPGSTTERTIYSLTLDGVSEKRLVSQPGNHLFPLYAPDGKSIYYVSGDDLVERPLDGKLRVVRKGIGRALPLGITAQGKLYYGLRTGTSDVFLADIGNIAASARRVSLRFPNRNLAPSFSLDGKRLAYLSRRGAENFGIDARAVVIRDLDSDGESELPVKMAHIERVHWRPDGQALYLGGSDGKGRGGIFEFDLRSGRTRPVVAEIGGPAKGFVFYPYRTGFVYFDGTAYRREDGEPAHDLPPLVSTLSEWLPSAAGLFGIRDGRLIQFTGAGERRFELPGNRQPGASISPDGKTIAITAGRESQEIWSVDLH